MQDYPIHLVFVFFCFFKASCLVMNTRISFVSRCMCVCVCVLLCSNLVRFHRKNTTSLVNYLVSLVLFLEKILCGKCSFWQHRLTFIILEKINVDGLMALCVREEIFQVFGVNCHFLRCNRPDMLLIGCLTEASTSHQGQKNLRRSRKVKSVFEFVLDLLPKYTLAETKHAVFNLSSSHAIFFRANSCWGS